jgi:hypothetical protein
MLLEKAAGRINGNFTCRINRISIYATANRGKSNGNDIVLHGELQAILVTPA